MWKVLAARLPIWSQQLSSQERAAQGWELLFRAAYEATLGAGGGVCWWELFQNNHRNLAGRGSRRWDLGLLIRGWGDALLSPTEHVPPPARPRALGSGVWGLDSQTSSITGVGTFVLCITGPEGHTARLEPAGDGGTQDGRAQLCSQESMKTQKWGVETG